jgi:predicted Rossmann fold flavoprotein
VKQQHLVVIGGGAAGFFCAVNAARLQPGLRVTLLEKTGKLLQKVKVSGGGRCNVTHACFEIPELVKHYPRGANFLKKSFHQFFTTHTIQWFEERGVALKTEADGRMFPVTNSSQTIIECLMKEASRYKVDILLNRDVHIIETASPGFTIHCKGFEPLACDYLCIASGGFPKPAAYQFIEALGHNIESPVPSLFTFNMPGNPVTELMGVAVVEAQVKINGTKLQQQGPLLITHWGISGPAVLKLSAWAARDLKELNYQFSITINWLPHLNEHTVRTWLQEQRTATGAQKIHNTTNTGLPKRLWQHLLLQTGIDEALRWADVTAKQQNLLAKNLCAQVYHVNGKTTFKEEFVTSGGVALSEVDANTMQSRLRPGLYFAGEILNIDGVTGGFNFQNAWTSGFIAAKSIAAAAPFTTV